MQVKDEFPGCCFGNYDAEANECSICEWKDECDIETKEKEDAGDIGNDDGEGRGDGEEIKAEGDASEKVEGGHLQ